jgi:hypothetical protein
MEHCNQTTNRIAKVYEQAEKYDAEKHSFQIANGYRSYDR